MVDSEMMSGHYYSDEVNVIDKLYCHAFVGQIITFEMQGTLVHISIKQ